MGKRKKTTEILVKCRHKVSLVLLQRQSNIRLRVQTVPNKGGEHYELGGRRQTGMLVTRPSELMEALKTVLQGMARGGGMFSQEMGKVDGGSQR